MNTKLFRRLSQIFVVGLITFIGIRHQVLGGGPEGSAPLDSYCPFGGVEAAFQFLRSGTFITKTNYSNFILLGAVIALAILAGRAFCSWLCPFGAVQEFLSFNGRKIFKRQFALPKTLDKYLRYMRYVVLALILVLTYRTATLVFETYDPFKVMFHFAFETTTAIVILAATIVISILVDRAWCKYLCPLGGLMSILGRFHLLQVKRNDALCAKCDLCSAHCPENINITAYDTINDKKCIKCLDCMSACPKEGALELQLGGASHAGR